MRTGMRCCIFTKLPAELSVGTREYLEPVAPEMAVIFLEFFVADGIDGNDYFLSQVQILNLGFLVVGYNPLLCVRQNVGDGLSGSDELSFFKSTPPQFPITRSYYYGVGEIQSCHSSAAVARCMAASVFSRRCDTSFTPDKAAFCCRFTASNFLWVAAYSVSICSN